MRIGLNLAVLQNAQLMVDLMNQDLIPQDIRAQIVTQLESTQNANLLHADVAFAALELVSNEYQLELDQAIAANNATNIATIKTALSNLITTDYQ